MANESDMSNMSLITGQDSSEREPSILEKLKMFNRRFLNLILHRIGLWYGLLTGLTISTQIAFARSLTGDLPLDQVVFIRSVFIILMITRVSWDASSSYTKFDLFLYVLFGVLNVTGVYASYIALLFTDSGNVNSVSANLVIPTAILSYFILEESITSKFSIPIFAVNFVGIILIANPSFFFGGDISRGLSDLFGVFLAFIALMSFALSRIVGRKCSLRGSMDASLMTFTSGAVGLLFGVFMLMSGSSWKMVLSKSQWIKLFFLSIFSLLANQFTVLGVQYEPANNVAILSTVSVPVAYIVCLIIFNEVPTILSITGAVMVLVSTFASYFIL